MHHIQIFERSIPFVGKGRLVHSIAHPGDEKQRAEYIRSILASDDFPGRYRVVQRAAGLTDLISNPNVADDVQ